jgi:hypothetical protein
MAKSKEIPFEFVIEELDRLHPIVKPMFGCHAVYVGSRIVFILRKRKDSIEDNGVWIATTSEHHESLRNEFPTMKSLTIFGPGPSGWQVLRESDSDFERLVYRACELVKARDPRIGKIPKPRGERKKQSVKKKKKVRR